MGARLQKARHNLIVDWRYAANEQRIGLHLPEPFERTVVIKLNLTKSLQHTAACQGPIHKENRSLAPHYTLHRVGLNAARMLLFSIFFQKKDNHPLAKPKKRTFLRLSIGEIKTPEERFKAYNSL